MQGRLRWHTWAKRWHFNDTSACVVCPAMVGTLQTPTAHTAFGQWCMAMRTAILQHSGLTRVVSKHHQRLVKQLHGQRPLPWQLVTSAYRIPMVMKG